MTQSDRILRALRKGTINTCDFQAPACDGGPPILRVAARIFDLQKHGHQITARRRSNGTTNYTLVREAEPAVDSHQRSDPSSGDPVGGSLGAPAHPDSSPGQRPLSPAAGAASELFDPAPFVERAGYRDAA